MFNDRPIAGSPFSSTPAGGIIGPPGGPPESFPGWPPGGPPGGWPPRSITDTKCYSCSKQCINTEFCSAGNSLNYESQSSVDYSLSRNIRVSIIANPEFWGFSGVLISGWATYSNGHYDFFDGYDEDHKAFKECSDNVITGPFINEQRPDVFYRSVYDPDTGITKHYGSNGSLEGSGIGRGGAEVYLIDRNKGLVSAVTQDKESCAEEAPHQIFRAFPENFGWGNKINFNTKIYRNMSGAWRLTSVENCYDEEDIFVPSGYLVTCDGQSKQNFASRDKIFQKYDYSRIKGTGDSSFYNYASECLPDGASVGKYAGYFSSSNSIYRSTGISEFVQARLSYGDINNPGPASSLKNGMTIGIKNEVNTTFNNVYTIFDVNHESTYTSVKFVGTSTGNLEYIPGISLPTGNFDIPIGLSGHWVAFNTHDEQTCCGLAAYGISEDKRFCGDDNYHTDFRRVFNNPKNIRQSNRDAQWRENYDLFSSITPIVSGVRIDHSYPSISGVSVSGELYGYPIIQSGDSYIVATGTGLIDSGYALFEREVSYYGNFFETDLYDNAKRLEAKINRGKGKNATCYSKHATLEIFPDCVTQYDKYKPCTVGEESEETQEIYVTNRLARLAFVYRGCDFNDNCSFDENGLPLGAWKDQGSVPTGINDLKRQLAGQEIHMFINLTNAWGGRKPGSPCNCDCDDEEAGKNPPQHVSVASPITYPHLPNFDLDPTGYGCLDPRHQISSIVNKLGSGAIADTSNYCDALHTSPFVCMPRQPYTTYGYIMNLCGKQNRDRKNVITEAFAKLHQEKTYTNATPEVDINEPMYWNIEAPDPYPYGGVNGIWGSGSTERDDGLGGFIQIGGSGYGYWGVTDSNKQLVAPYFCTQQGSFICCDATGIYIDYSRSGTYQNVLNTANGWPTDKVPFLIEMEFDDACGGCVSASMKNQTLNLEIEGLDTEFIWAQKEIDMQGDVVDPLSRLGRYGHNYCKYGKVVENVAFLGKAKLDRPDYSCDTGFDLEYCGDSNFKARYSNSYVGNTCSCANGLSVTLHPIVISGSNDVILGWTSNKDGGAIGLTEIKGCGDINSSYLAVGYDEKPAFGYRIFAEFELACTTMFNYLSTPRYPDAKYEGDPLTQLYQTRCGHHYPAIIGNGGDLELRARFYMIAEPWVSTFRKFSETALKRIGYSADGIINSLDSIDDFITTFGLCPGDKVYTWGCKPEGTYFYGCDDGEGKYYDYPACSGNACNNCPVGDGEGEVTCICDSVVGYEGIIPSPLPIAYSLNECECLCLEPHLLAEYVVDENLMADLVSTEAECAAAYWVSSDNIDPILLSTGPPAPYVGIYLGGYNSTDWYDWNHGVNGVSNGIEHELWSPYLGVKLPSNNECPQLTIDASFEPGSVISCSENTGCLNQNTNSKTCGPPIYNTEGVTVRKKKCHPEVAIVTKIECLGSSYKLFISREYHEHDRKWQERIIIGSGETEEDICIPVNAGAYSYNDGTSSGCLVLPYATLADSITPVYNPPCSIHPSSGVYVNQDYKYQNAGFPSGSFVWNYFNLFYSSTHLPSVDNGSLLPSIGRDESGNYDCNLTPLSIENTGTILPISEYQNPAIFKGIFATNQKHSCVQDSVECGGELWCNKLFFPRHSYKAGTRIAPFGGGQICTANNEISVPDIFDGYIEQKAESDAGGRISYTIENAESLLSEAKTRFIDWCDDSIIQYSIYDIDIDDDYLFVKDYLPLIGVTHPGWRFTSDVKSCTIGGSGCQDTIPTHTENTILAGIHQPKTWNENSFESMGYYLDRFGVSSNSNEDGYIRASGIEVSGSTDQCLFNPFKIMIDVECNLNRIARKNFPFDPPTFLQGVQSWPSRACLGIITTPGCGCGLTQCKYATKNTAGECTLFRIAETIATITTDASGECIGDDPPYARWFHHSKLTPAGPYRRCNSPAEVAGEWATSPCLPGSALRIGPDSYVRSWQCNNNQYLSSNPNQFIIYPDECDCKTAIENGLCSASIFCEDYTSCDCNPIPTGVEYNVPTPISSGIDQWWVTDCECDQFPQDDATASYYCSDSLVKWIITE
jgi:hypothetical protein